jgi:hypothetical protein
MDTAATAHDQPAPDLYLAVSGCMPSGRPERVLPGAEGADEGGVVCADGVG